MNIEQLKETITRHEGLRLDLYQCTANANTIGVGHNLDAKGISAAVAALMLEVVQEALVNLCFNMGIPRLMQFKKTLAYIQEGDYKKAANELLDSRYAHQVGYRAVEVAQMIRSAA